MISKHFPSDMPRSSYVRRPEFAEDPTIRGLLPGETIYLTAPFGCVINEQTGELCITTSRAVMDSERHPPQYVSQAGIQRVYDTIEGSPVNGFVADFRRSTASLGGINTLHPRDLDAGTQPLLAAVFCDLDGQAYFSGDERLAPYVLALMKEVDEVAGNVADPTEAAPPLTTDYWIG